MIHYHGLPITPTSTARKAIQGGHAFLSFRYPDQYGLAVFVASSFAVDNGAFSAWKAGEPVTDWTPYYQCLDYWQRIPSFDFAVIPDVIDGTEEENDDLMNAWPFSSNIGAPVWHLHESLGRLWTMTHDPPKWPRICIGSSAEYAKIGTPSWWRRMAEAMDVICNEDGFPVCKIHGLRMLDPVIYTAFPFSSADSTNIAQNVGIDSAWRGTYTPASKETRALVMRERIEMYQSPIRWDREDVQHQGVLELT